MKKKKSYVEEATLCAAQDKVFMITGENKVNYEGKTISAKEGSITVIR